MSSFKLISRGVIGTDMIFENAAILHGHARIILNDEKVPKRNDFQLDPMQIALDRDFPPINKPEFIPKNLFKIYHELLVRISKDNSNVRYPTNDQFINNILCRDTMVSMSSDEMYVVSGFDETNKIIGNVSWSCYMFLYKMISNVINTHIQPGFVPFYLYDQFKYEWYQAEIIYKNDFDPNGSKLNDFGLKSPKSDRTLKSDPINEWSKYGIIFSKTTQPKIGAFSKSRGVGTIKYAGIGIENINVYGFVAVKNLFN